MTPLALGLTLLSSLCWSGFDLVRKRLASRLSPSTAVIALMVGQLPLFGMLGIAEGWRWPMQGFWAPAGLSIALNIAANVLFLKSVQLAPLSLAVPMLSFTPVFGAATGFLILGEKLTPRQWIGVGFVIFGALALQGLFKRKTPVANTLTAGARTGVWLMVVVAFLWSVTPVIDKIGLRSTSVSFYAFFQCLGIALALWILRLKARSPRETAALAASAKDLGLAVLVASGALFTQFLAIQEMPVGLFEALKRALGLVAALSFGAWFFAEAVTREKILAVLLMGSGIALILV